MPFMVTQACSLMVSSPSPTDGAQDLHEKPNVLEMQLKMQHFLIKMNCTELVGK